VFMAAHSVLHAFVPHEQTERVTFSNMALQLRSLCVSAYDLLEQSRAVIAAGEAVLRASRSRLTGARRGSTSVENLTVEERHSHPASEEAQPTVGLAQLSLDDDRILRHMERSVQIVFQPSQLARALRLSPLTTRSRLDALTRLGLVDRVHNPQRGEPEFMLTVQGGEAVSPLHPQRLPRMAGSPRIRLSPDIGDDD
jgi:DNA-binding MarR family transcriptional regulator